MFEKIKEWALRKNDEGIALPILRDNKTKKGSYTLTMFVTSFTLTILFKMSKIAKVTGEVDFWEMLALTVTMGGFYMGRQFQVSKDGSVQMSGDPNQQSSQVQPQTEKDVSEPPV